MIEAINSLSVVITVFNEEKRLKKNLIKIINFIKNKKIEVPKKINLKFSISLLNKGNKSRQLNDLERFAKGYNPKNSNGDPITKYGYYHFETNHIFIFNEIMNGKMPNKMFKTVLAHEIFHALTHQNNLIEKMPHPIYESDERMAREFTLFLGLGE